MKNAFFHLKSSFHPKDIKLLSSLFGHVAKWLDKKGKVNFKFDDVTVWLAIVIHILSKSREVKAIRQ